MSSRNNSSDSNTNDINPWAEQARYHEQRLKPLFEKNNENNGSSITFNVLTHIDNETHLPKQVDISEKKASSNGIRVARASGYIQLNETAFAALVNNKLKKGNALIVAQLAGIQASKWTAHLIPLCHQVQLDVCDVQFNVESELRRVRCEATCKTATSRTGVEMEALTACSVSLLTLYDMCKAVQKDAVICDVRLESKSGGKSDFNRL
jgi:molybdenum cofactor biosynthesis protein MoaC